MFESTVCQEDERVFEEVFAFKSFIRIFLEEVLNKGFGLARQVCRVDNFLIFALNKR